MSKSAKRKSTSSPKTPSKKQKSDINLDEDDTEISFVNLMNVILVKEQVRPACMFQDDIELYKNTLRLIKKDFPMLKISKYADDIIVSYNDYNKQKNINIGEILGYPPICVKDFGLGNDKYEYKIMIEIEDSIRSEVTDEFELFVFVCSRDLSNTKYVKDFVSNANKALDNPIYKKYFNIFNAVFKKVRIDIKEK